MKTLKPLARRPFKYFLKELLCRHEYQFGNMHSKNKTFLIAAKRCMKCGKVKKI